MLDKISYFLAWGYVKYEIFPFYHSSSVFSLCAVQETSGLAFFFFKFDLTKWIWNASPRSMTQTLWKAGQLLRLSADAPGGVAAFSCSHSSSPRSVLTRHVSHAPEALKV